MEDNIESRLCSFGEREEVEMEEMGLWRTLSESLKMKDRTRS